jgi:hypothetical protein
MNHWRLLMLAIAGFSSTGLAQEMKSMLRFSNGDQLSGMMESLSGEQIVWNSPIQVKPAPYWLKSVQDMTLPASIPDYPATHEATLTLARGDSIRGQLASVTDEKIALDTWFAGRLEFPRVMVRELKIEDRPVTFYRGPTSLEGWKQTASPPSWSFLNGSFLSKSEGGIGREMKMPDEVRIGFDAAWRGSFRMTLVIFSDNVSAEKPENGYELVFNQRNVYLRRSGTNVPLGNSTNVREFQENEKARIEIRASRRTGTICFYIDGKIKEVWNVPDLATDEIGSGLSFIASGTSPLKISRIEVLSWDGVVDELPEQRDRGDFGFRGNEIDPAPEVTPLRSGRMLLRNGDDLEGEVQSIEDGMITVKTAFSEVKFPVERLRNIVLKPADLEEPKREAGDVRAWFLDGSSIVFRLDGMDGDTITGFSQNFGTAHFKVSAFNRLEFNVAEAEIRELRGDPREIPEW